jgi:hypothetical protein
MDARVGAGLVTVKVVLAEVPPPGPGFVTVIGTVAPEAISAAGTVEVMLVAEI